MNKTVSVNVRISPNLKKKVDVVCDNIGIPVTSAITVFLNKFVDSQGFPFAVTMNNAGTCPICEAHNYRLKPEIEAELLENDETGSKRFSNIDDLWGDLESESD